MPRILVVEDVDEMRLLLQQMLEGIPGVKVSGLAANGWDARVEVSRRRPDLVLLDEILPGESSLDLLLELTEQEVPVLLITVVSDPRHELPPQALGRAIKPGWKSLEQDKQRFALEIQKALSIQSVRGGSSGKGRVD